MKMAAQSPAPQMKTGYFSTRCIDTYGGFPLAEKKDFFYLRLAQFRGGKKSQDQKSKLRFTEGSANSLYIKSPFLDIRRKEHTLN